MDRRRGHCRRHRHCEAAQRPKPSRRAVQHVMDGRRAAWPCPILDCFARACARARNDGEVALASLALAMAGNASARESRPRGGPPRASSANHFALIRSFLTVCGRRKAVSTPACAKNLPPVRDRPAGVATRASRCAADGFARLRAARRFTVWYDENTCFIETFVIERRSR